MFEEDESLASPELQLIHFPLCCREREKKWLKVRYAAEANTPLLMKILSSNPQFELYQNVLFLPSKWLNKLWVKQFDGLKIQSEQIFVLKWCNR